VPLSVLCRYPDHGVLFTPSPPYIVSRTWDTANVGPREGESWVNLGHVVPMGPPRGIKKYSPSLTAILMEEACDYRASKIDFGVGNLVNPPSCKRVNVRAGGLGRSCGTAMIYCNDA